MYISRIYLKNIRGFSELNINFLDSNAGRKRPSRSPRKRTVIIGKNGTCKTTLLRCIAIGLSDEKDASGLVSEPIGQLVREPFKHATIHIDLLGAKNGSKKVSIITELSAERGQNKIKSQITRINERKASPVNSYKARKNLFVCGYGVGRSNEGASPLREYRIIDSVYSLFNYEQTMIITELALRRLTDYVGTRFYDKSMEGIKNVLHLSAKHDIRTPRGGGITIHGPELGKGIPIQAWADGYRLTFLWLLDLYAWAMQARKITITGGINGILLVDEIEQHLHPAMQSDILNRLSTLFPSIQIITASHSPLVALGVSQSELVTLKRDGNQVKRVKELPNTEGYSAEDILIDPDLFDVANVYKPEVNEKLIQYRQLTSIIPAKRTPSQKRKLKSLSTELLSQHIPEIQTSKVTKEFKKILRKYVNK